MELMGATELSLPIWKRSTASASNLCSSGIQSQPRKSYIASDRRIPAAIIFLVLDSISRSVFMCPFGSDHEIMASLEIQRRPKRIVEDKLVLLLYEKVV
jgi:hypothetical protein